MIRAAPDRRPTKRPDESPDDALARELIPGERLLWTGRPPQGLDLRATDVRNLLGYAASEFLQFVFFFNVGGPVVAVVNGLLTAAAGTHLFHRVVTLPARRRRTSYGLTPARVLVAVRGPRGVEVRSMWLAELGAIRLTERADGSGFIDLCRPRPPVAGGLLARLGWPGRRLAMIELAADARRVYDQVRAARRTITQPLTPSSDA